MRAPFAAIALSLVVGCGDDTTSTPDAGPPDAGTAPRRDAGPMPTAFAYEPAGCGYPVSTPEVRGAGMSEDVFGATPSADHVHVSWAGPSHTSFAVNWRSDDETLASRVLYGTDRAAVEAAEGAGAGVLEQLGHHMVIPDLTASADFTRIHEAHVCGLTPATRYYYKVGGPGHWSAVHETATAPEPGSTAPWSFGVTGDSRDLLDNGWAIGQRKMDERGIDLEVFTGDMVDVGVIQSQWDAWFESSDGTFVVQDMLARVPLMPVNGNHDILAVNYVAQFALPQHVAGDERAEGEEWYSFDYANAHFVMLNDTRDTSILDSSQTDWLRSDLAAVDRARTPWIFVVHHSTLYSCDSNHPPNRNVRAEWQPIFDEHRVDLVLAGHNHVYERTKPIRGLDASREGVVAAEGPDGAPAIAADGTPSGTIYVVAGGAGADLYGVRDDCAFSQAARSTLNHVVVEIDDRTIRLTAYETLTGAVIDAFTYSK